MAKVEKVVKTFYDALEEGKILARRCKKCGHIEYPPYYACNECGNLETEWIELPQKAVCTQLIMPMTVMVDPGFKGKVGTYFVGDIQIEGCDPVNASLVNIDKERYEELRKQVPFPVKPVIIQEDGYKNVFWTIDE